MSQRKNPAAGEFYRHFKGNLYQIIGIAKDSETLEQVVVYQALYGDFGLYTRPLAMFLSPVDKEKYPEAGKEYRFEQVQPEKISTVSEAGKAEDSVVKTVAAAKDTGTSVGLQNKVVFTEAAVEDAPEETVREEILRFLDAEGAIEKLEVLRQLRNNMDENLLTTIELSMDLLPDEREGLERRYELVERTLEQKIRFEGGRLR